MNRSVAFLESQIKVSGEELNRTGEKLKNFQSTSSIEILEKQLNSKSEILLEQENRLRTAQVEKQQLAAQLESLQEEIYGTSQFISSEQVNPVSGSITTVQVPNPVYAALQQKKAEAKTLQASKQAEIETLISSISLLQADIAALQEEIIEKKAAQEKLAADVERLKNTVDTLERKKMETKIAKSIDLGDSNVIIVSPASVPTSPIKPNKKLNIAIALVFGLMIFTLLAFILEYLDNTLKNADDVVKQLDLPVIGVIPQNTEF